jgi:Holliday junction resolvase-like predicted endonuclease
MQVTEQENLDSFWYRLKRGRRFETWERAQWAAEDSEKIVTEASTQWKGKRGRIDLLLLNDEEDYAVVVELKATDWDKMAAYRVRPNALRHARQIWRYIEARLEESSVIPALVYLSSPRTTGRKEEVEAILNEQGIQVVWRDDEYKGCNPHEEIA